MTDLLSVWGQLAEIEMAIDEFRRKFPKYTEVGNGFDPVLKPQIERLQKQINSTLGEMLREIEVAERMSNIDINTHQIKIGAVKGRGV